MIELSQETEALARRLASAQQISIEQTVRRALDAHARAVGVAEEAWRPRELSAEEVAARRARIDRIVENLAAMPVLDPRDPREIMDDLNAL